MSELFSGDWMKSLKKLWNDEKGITDPLMRADFSATIGYGFKGEGAPRGILVIEAGRVMHADRFEGEPVDWDLRATPESWQGWIEQGFGLTQLGPAVATQKLLFVAGNYRQMIRNPSLSNPFMRHFKLMSAILTDI